MRQMPLLHKKLGIKWNLFIGILVAIAILGFAGFIFLTPKQDVELTFDGSTEMNLGEASGVAMIFSNNTGSAVSEVSLSFTLPKGVIFETGRGVSRTKDIGMVEAGKSVKEIFQIITTDEKAEAKEIRVTATYLPPTTKKKISIQETYKFKIKRPIEVTLDLPEKIVSGELFDWSVKYKNNSDKNLDFSVNFSSPKELKTDFETKKISLKPGEEFKSQFTGEAILSEGQSFDVKLSVSGSVKDQTLLLYENTSAILMAPSWLSIKTKVSGTSPEGNVKPGSELKYTVSIRNNTDQSMNDVRTRIALSGLMYDFATIMSAGQIDRNSGTVYLTAADIVGLKQIDPGSLVEIPLTVRVSTNYPIKQFGDKNFTLRADVQVESLSVPKISRANKTVNVSSLETKVSGMVELKSRAYFRDASSGILNDGDLPLSVGKPVEFTIHWTIKDFASDMENVKISAELPPGITVTDMKKVSVGDFKYDSESQTISWTIPKTLASTGVLTKPLEVVFQVKGVPDASQIGQYMTILGNSEGEAIDSFTGDKIYFGADPITSALPDDRTITPQDGIVK